MSSPRAHRRNGVVSYSVRFRGRWDPSSRIPVGRSDEGMNRARAEHDACKPDALRLQLTRGSGPSHARRCPHVWTCDSRGYLLETPGHVFQIGRALDAGERLSESVGELRRGARVQISLGRRETGMTHGGLHGGQVDPARDQKRAVGMSQIVETHRPQSGGITCSLDASPDGRPVEPASEAVDEDVVVGGGEVPALGEAVEGARRLVGERTSRARRDFVDLVSTFALTARRTTILRRVKSTSRHRSATSSPRRRPAYAATRTSSPSWRSSARRASTSAALTAGASGSRWSPVSRLRASASTCLGGVVVEAGRLGLGAVVGSARRILGSPYVASWLA